MNIQEEDLATVLINIVAPLVAKSDSLDRAQALVAVDKAAEFIDYWVQVKARLNKLTDSIDKAFKEYQS